MEIITKCPHCSNDITITVVKREKPVEQPSILEGVKCPECSSPMVSRHGKFGTFWGCTKYPECRGTRDSMGRSRDERMSSRGDIENQQDKGFSFNRRYD